MKIIVIGNTSSIGEFKNKFSTLIDNINQNQEASDINLKDNLSKNVLSFKEIFFVENYDDLDEGLLLENTVVFDFYLDDSIENFEPYKNYGNLIIFGNIPKSSLAEIHFFSGGYDPLLYGFNGMPGMLNRQFLEVTISTPGHQQRLSEICQALGTEFLIVEDRVGMVTPRVACMIINEAYFTVQERTATKEDIDLAMKSGTKYPYGPFEWCRNLGIRNVYELLEALYEDTKDERYKICPLLKKEYLLA